MLLLIALILLPSISPLENCTIDFNQTFTAKLPDQVVTKINETYTIIEVDPEGTDAKCLDGSNYKFLFHEGTGEGKNKFIFLLQGGGFCGYDGYETLLSCYKRSSQAIGSSTSYGSNGSLHQNNESMGYASSNPEFNPLFWNWNILYLLYCDGTMQQGYLKDPLYYNDTALWLRGFNNTMSGFEYARKNLNLFDAAEVLIAGGSSGGTAAIVWASYLQDYLPKNIRFFGISDGGLSLDVYSNASGCFLHRFFMQNLVSLTNASENQLYRKCQYFGNASTIWKCMLPQYMFKSVEIDFFLANSQYDEVQLATQLGVICMIEGGPLFCSSRELATILKYREQSLRVALKIKKNKPTWGFWLRTCFEHTYYNTWAWYGNTMNVFNAEAGIAVSFKDVLTSWYNQGEKKTKNQASFIDLLDWKHNPNCVYDELFRDESDFYNATETI